MDALLKGLFRGSKSAPSAASSPDDADFADFAGAPAPSPASILPVSESLTSAQAAVPTFGSSSAVPYTKWYRVWERVTYRDFWQEAFILPFILAIVFLHVWGRGKNKRKARSWIQAHAPVLEKEFAVVGFGGRQPPSIDDVQSSGLAKASLSDDLDIPSELLKEKTAQEYVTYATGRQNVAFLDVKIKLFKRYNPGYLVAESIMAFFIDSIKTPIERMEATAYAFDGKEKDLIPVPNKQERDNLEARVKSIQSSYDGFVWAVVNKDGMRQLRDDRYDISLTSTKDHPRLPPWATVMSESAEVTETLLTPELIKAIEQAGDAFEHLIVTDQPADKPLKLNDTTPRKRLHLSLRLPPTTTPEAYTRTLPLFTLFLRLPDLLASSAHFRPEVLRKIRGTRDAAIAKLRKVDEDERAEERKLEGDRKKKEVREGRLKGMSAEEQRRFLERERERGQKRQGKKMTRKA